MNLMRTNQAPKFVTPAAPGQATHMVIALPGITSVTLPQAVQIINQARAGSAGALQYVAAMQQGKTPDAIGTTALLETADDLQTQMDFVSKWFGEAQAQQLSAGSHIATPVVQSPAVKRAVVSTLKRKA